MVENPVSLTKKESSILGKLAGTLLESSHFHLYCRGNRQKQTLSWLKKNGYHELSSFLKDKTDYPWNEILNLNTPIIMEQMVALALASHHQSTLKLAFSCIRAHPHPQLLDETNNLLIGNQEILETLGKLTYLADQSIFPENLTKIDTYFNDLFLKKLAVLKKNAKDTKVNPESFLSTQFPILAGKMAITREGKVNPGLLLAITKQDIPLTPNAMKSFHTRVQQLIASTEIRDKFSEITLSTNESIYFVLRTLLQIPPEEIPTFVDARKAALGTFLTHMRQTANTSCFSTSICTTQLASLPLQVLNDFKLLFKDGCLHRSTGKDVKKVPFLLTTSPLLLTTPEYGPMVLDKIKKTSKNEREFRKNCFMCESLTQNALFSIWRNSIANMSEIRVSGMLKKEVFLSVSAAFNVAFSNLTKEQVSLKNQMISILKKTLLKRLHLVYDPMADSSTLESAFVMYDSKLKTSVEEWDRIENEEEFQSFIKEAVEEAGCQLSFLDPEQKNDHFLKQLTKSLSKYSESDLFLKQILDNYLDQKSEAGTPSDYHHKPWFTKTGNDTETTLRSYHCDINEVAKYQITPSSGENLLEQIVLFFQKSRSIIKPLIEKTNSLLLPCRIPEKHAFSLAPNHPTFAHLWMQKQNPSDRIEELQAFANEISNQTITHKMITEITNLLDCDTRGISTDLSIKEWRNRLIETNQIDSTLLDKYLFLTLPKDQQDKIKENTIFFADSNWASNGQDMLYGFIINPGTGDIEVWNMNEDYSDINVLEQEIWVNNTTWDIYKSTPYFTNLQALYN